MENACLPAGREDGCVGYNLRNSAIHLRISARKKRKRFYLCELTIFKNSISFFYRKDGKTQRIAKNNSSFVIRNS